jgi:putative ABC transport system ATP-binding protein
VTPAVEVRRLEKTFGDGPLAFRALKGVDLTVPRGELLMLAGPSGSGKTTLLSIIGCVLAATSGEVRVLGRDVTQARASELPGFRLSTVGFVFQGHNLIASLSARDNVALPLEMSGVSQGRARERARALLERVGLGDKCERPPAELSGGQRQRVAIARALAGDPPLVLADEPTAALDAKSGLEVAGLLRELCRERGGTAIVVTHDSRIFHLADRILHVEDGLLTTEEKRA